MNIGEPEERTLLSAIGLFLFTCCIIKFRFIPSAVAGYQKSQAVLNGSRASIAFSQWVAYTFDKSTRRIMTSDQTRSAIIKYVVASSPKMDTGEGRERYAAAVKPADGLY